jgi:hypothetical protein
LLADSTGLKVYINGNLSDSLKTSLTGCNQSQFNIGGIPAFGSVYYHDKHQSEILIYNAGIADADRKTIEADQENYYATTTAPLITSFTPTQGNTGTVVTITGTNFTGATAVKFGGMAAASFTVVSPTTITAVLGTGAKGQVSVTTAKGTAVLSGFSYGSGLDKVTANLAANAAYSLRQLKTTYSHTAITAPAAVAGFSNSATPVIRVRRSSDDALLDIGYTASGDLDTTTLKSFVGIGNGYVQTWYDQSSNSFDVVQNISTQQPLIVTAGVVERSGIMPAIRFTASSQTILQNSIPASTMFGSGYIGSVFPVLEATGGYVSAFGYAQNQDRWQFGGSLDVGSPTKSMPANNTTYAGVLKNYSLMADITGLRVYINGMLTNSLATTLTACNQSQFNIGGIPAFGSAYYHDKHQSEIIMYNIGLSDADRQTVEANQAAYYASLTAPTITYFTPQGHSGTTVTISGTNFGGASSVRFGGTPAASFTVISSTTITAVLGAGASGTVSVTTARGTATMGGFRFGNSLDKINTNLSASAAYSLRQVKTSYVHTPITAPAAVTGFTNATTPVIRVRRSADDALLDIGYTAGGDLDTTTLKSFVGTGNGYVQTWYDQSSNSYDVVQNIATQQPLIVTAGVVERSGIMPAIRFINGSQTVLQANIAASDMFGSGYIGSVFPVLEATGGYVSAFGYGQNNDRWQFGGTLDVGYPTKYVIANNSGYAGILKNYSLLADTTGLKVYINGSLSGSLTTSLTACNQSQFNIGGIPNFGSIYYHDKHQSEIIIYNVQMADSDRITIENNQAAYYEGPQQQLSMMSFAVQMVQPQMVTGNTSNSTVKLDWTARGGAGTSTYQLQKMTAFGFTDISVVNGGGTGAFTGGDQEPLTGNNLYRVAATDSRGNKAFSGTVSLNVASGGKGISVYPNPVSDKTMMLSFKQMAEGLYKLTITDAMGHTLKVESLRYDGYSGSVAIPINLQTGVYFVNISSESYQRIIRVVIL